MAGRVGEETEQVGDVATNFKGAIDKSLNQQPMATLAAGRTPAASGSSESIEELAPFLLPVPTSLALQVRQARE